jgi:Protein of unknown function (DUF3618)
MPELRPSSITPSSRILARQPPPSADRDRTAEQIMQDMAEARLRIGRTLDVLQRKLEPANLAHEATDAIKSALSLRRLASFAGGVAKETCAGPNGEPEGAAAGESPKVLDVLADAAVNAIAAVVKETLTPREPPPAPMRRSPRKRSRSRNHRDED